MLPLLFTLVALPYAPEALEPVISRETIEYHYGKHLQTYVDNLNALLPGSNFEGLSLEDILCRSEGPIFNNAGQIINHNLYFTQLRSPREDNLPTGILATLINQQYGSFDAFKQAFEKAALTLFGSGWVWLSIDADKQLHISQEHNAGNPIAKGLTPLLTFDVWEHAYYLNYQNRRAAHISALWSLINWDEVNERLG